MIAVWVFLGRILVVGFAKKGLILPKKSDFLNGAPKSRKIYKYYFIHVKYKEVSPK